MGLAAVGEGRTPAVERRQRGRADWLLAGLDPEQRAVVTHPARSVAVLAGPGSGKTRVLTTRLAHRIVAGDLDPARALVVTFTRRAAQELRSRLGGFGIGGPSGPTILTLHALAVSSLQRAWATAGEPARGIAPYPLRLLAPIVQDLGHAGTPVPTPRTVAAEVAWAKARAVGPDAYADAAERAGRLRGWDARALEAVGRAYAAYEAEKQARRVLDVDDLLPALAARLRADPALAEALRWHHQHVFVDEFQDLGRAAFRLVRGLLPEDPARADLFVVGDADQAVYGFAGADPRLLLRLGEALPGTEVLRLERTRRCAPGVLAAAQAVRDGALPDPAVVRATCAGTGAPTDQLALQAIAFDDPETEAAQVAWSLRAAHATGRPWSQLAVLARTNARLDAVAAACEREGIPTRSRRCLLDRPEVRATLDALQWRPSDLRAPVVRSVVKELAAETLANPEVAPPARRSLTALVALAEEYAWEAPRGTLDGFLAWLDGTVRAEGGDPAEAGDAVDLLTFHRAKGLEWDVVHVVGVDATSEPARSSEDPRAEAEERRLRYVALTRARLRVVLTHVGAPAPWLDDALRAAATLVEGPVAPPATIRRLRSRLPAPADPAVDRIVAWRTARARAAGLAPSTILPDAALAAVLRFRPRSVDELEQVPGVGRARARSLGPALLPLLHPAG